MVGYETSLVKANDHRYNNAKQTVGIMEWCVRPQHLQWILIDGALSRCECDIDGMIWSPTYIVHGKFCEDGYVFDVALSSRNYLIDLNETWYVYSWRYRIIHRLRFIPTFPRDRKLIKYILTMPLFVLCFSVGMVEDMCKSSDYYVDEKVAYFINIIMMPKSGVGSKYF